MACTPEFFDEVLSWRAFARASLPRFAPFPVIQVLAAAPVVVASRFIEPHWAALLAVADAAVVLAFLYGLTVRCWSRVVGHRVTLDEVRRLVREAQEKGMAASCAPGRTEALSEIDVAISEARQLLAMQAAVGGSSGAVPRWLGFLAATLIGAWAAQLGKSPAEEAQKVVVAGGVGLMYLAGFWMVLPAFFESRAWKLAGYLELLCRTRRRIELGG